MFGLISGPVLAHALGPEGRGQFSGVMEPITVAAAVAALGAPTAVTYYVAGSRGPRGAIWRRGAVLVACTSVVVFLVMAVYSSAVSEALGLPRWVVIAAWLFTIPAAIVQVRRGYWQGLGDWARLDIERFSFAALRLLAVLACALVGVVASSFYIGAALLAFAAAAVLLWWPRGRAAEPAQGAVADLPPLKQMLNYSFLASLGSIAVVSNNRLDQALMPAQTTPQELGLYAVAVTVAEIPLVFSALAARDVLQLGSARVGLTAMVRHTALYVGAFVIGTIAMAALSPWLLPLVFGQQFEAAVASIQWLAISTFCGGTSWILGNLLSSAGRVASGAVIPLIGLATTVVLFVVFWGRIDALEAAQISAATQGASMVVGCVLTYFVLIRHRRER